MPSGKYKGVSLPKELVDEVEVRIKKEPRLGYSSVAEFVKDAIRDKLRQLDFMSSEVERVVDFYSGMGIRPPDIEETIRNFKLVLAILSRKLMEFQRNPSPRLKNDIMKTIATLEAASLILERYDVFFGLQSVKLIIEAKDLKPPEDAQERIKNAILLEERRGEVE